MTYRLRVLLQGIGALVLLFAIAAGATYAGTRIHSAAGGTPTPPPAKVATLENSRPVLDPKTGAEAQVEAAILLLHHAGVDRSTEVLLARVMLVTGNSSARVDPANFFAMDSSGQGYAATAKVAGYPAMQPVVLPHNHNLSAWIGFEIPRSSATYTIAWNDDNHLLPPAILARITT